MALAVTFSIPVFPATVVTATTSSSGACHGEQKGHRVVVAGIAVDDHWRRHGATCWRAGCLHAVMHIAALLLSAAFAAQAAPVATTGDEESVSTGSAVVTGTVDPNGEATSYYVEYGTSSNYGAQDRLRRRRHRNASPCRSASP